MDVILFIIDRDDDKLFRDISIINRDHIQFLEQVFIIVRDNEKSEVQVRAIV